MLDVITNPDVQRSNERGVEGNEDRFEIEIPYVVGCCCRLVRAILWIACKEGPFSEQRFETFFK